MLLPHWRAWSEWEFAAIFARIELVRIWFSVFSHARFMCFHLFFP